MNSGITINWRRICRYLLVMSLVLVLAYSYILLNDPQTLPISLVRVEGNLQYLDKNLLENSIEPYVTGGFFNIDVAKVQSVLLAMPWIAKVAVQRIWPDSLKVTVEERKPVARWGDKKLLDRDGTILNMPRQYQKSKLPALYGSANQLPNLLMHWQKMNEALSTIKLEVKWLSLSERHAWDAELTNGTLIRLGKDNAFERLQRFINIYRVIISQEKQPIRYADLRYTNGIAVGV